MANRPKSTRDIFSRGRKKIDRFNTSSQSMNENREPHAASTLSRTTKLREENEQLKDKIKEQCNRIRELELENHQLKAINDQLIKYQDEFLDREMLSKNKKGRFFNVTKNFQMKFLKRPPKEELVARNIYKNEPCFDNFLDSIEKHTYYPNVPRLIIECAQLLENTPGYMETPGLYRVSANFSQLQKIRFKINQNNYKFLKEEKDPHLFAGLIKLFLRELKNPLISMDYLNSHFTDFSDPLDFLVLEKDFQIKRMIKIISSLPPINRDTTQYLMKHLNKVLLNPENQMDVQSLSIVIGACIFYELMGDLKLTDNLLKCSIPNFSIELMIMYYSEVFEVV